MNSALKEILNDFEVLNHQDCDNSCGNKLTEEDMVKAILNWHRKQAVQALWDLHEYMGQFPDDLSLAVMHDRIKLMEQITNDN